MKLTIQSVVLTTMLLCSFVLFGQEKNAESTYVENEFIIWLMQDVDAQQFAIRADAGITPKRLLYKRLNIWLFEISDSREPREDKMQRLILNDDVRVIQNNHVGISLRSLIPDDPYFEDQWGSVVMQLPQAWEEFGTGGLTVTGDTIVVAVIDDGFYLEHEDLKANFWKNYKEIPGNGIDDDDNGYIDDFDGWNAYNHSGNMPSSTYYIQHGTSVTGVISGVGNNGIGICGINWNVKLMPVAGSSENEDADEATIVEAYGYALEMRARYNETDGAEGAFIVSTNSSFGVDYGQPADFPIWCSMFDEMGYQGMVSSCAGPNRAVNIDEVGDVPTTCPGDYLIGVTNINESDELHRSTGFGIENVDIGAPGTNIPSTFVSNYGYNYSYETGTSLASPQVAGTVALMYSAMDEEMIEDCKHNPADFALKARQALLDGADHLEVLEGKVAEARRLNAYGAITNLLTTYETLEEQTSESFKVYPNPANGQFTVEGTGQMTVSNTLGQTVMTQHVDGQAAISLPKGLYFIKIGGKVTKIIVK